MIEELFEGRKDRTVEVSGRKYLVFPLNDISFRSLPNGSPGDISHALAEGLAIVQSTSAEGPLVYVNLTRLDNADMNVIPVGFLYPNPLIVKAVRHFEIRPGWEHGPSIYAERGDRQLSIHCMSERNYQMVQAEIYVQWLLEIQGKVLAGK